MIITLFMFFKIFNIIDPRELILRFFFYAKKIKNNFKKVLTYGYT